jgi:hypothetical protein
MQRGSQEKLRVLCLVLLAAGALACGGDEPAPGEPEPAKEVPFWALCENWRRRDGSCDQEALLADYEDCLGTEGTPTKQRLLNRQARRLTVSRAWQRATIVCIEKRRWRMTEAGRQNLPGREAPAR